MRRDVFHYFATDVPNVFNAYCQAVKEKFGQTCTALPYHTLSFGLGFSFRYNMNGGSCNLHFIPYNNGTAVCVHYSIAQALGARYGAHDKHMLELVEKKLNVKSQSVDLNVEMFLNEENRLTSAQAPTPAPTPTPIPTPTPVQVAEPQQQSLAIFCPNCGIKFGEKDVFCYNCGKKR